MLRHLFVFPQALFLVLFAGASVSTMAMPETSTNAMSLTVEEARISKLRAVSYKHLTLPTNREV